MDDHTRACIEMVVQDLNKCPQIVCYMDQGEPGVDYDEPNLNPLICDICNQKFDSLDKLGEHQKQAHDM